MASALSQLQKLFLFFLVSGLLVVAFAVNFDGGPAAGTLLAVYGVAALAGMLWMLVCTYRCASGTGRSGILWVVLVFFFKLIGLIAICWVTRRWADCQGSEGHQPGHVFPATCRGSV